MIVMAILGIGFFGIYLYEQGHSFLGGLVTLLVIYLTILYAVKEN